MGGRSPGPGRDLHIWGPLIRSRDISLLSPRKQQATGSRPYCCNNRHETLNMSFSSLIPVTLKLRAGVSCLGSALAAAVLGANMH